MEIKDETMTTATDAEGNEYIAEIDATITETSSDGTETTSDMELTANPDDPTEIEGHMTITQVAPDGTETVTEIISNEDGMFIVEEESSLEQMAEAILGVEIDDNLTQIDENGNVIESDSEVYQAESVSDEDDFTDDEETYDTFSDSTDEQDFYAAEETDEPTYDTIEPEISETPAFEPSYSESPIFDPNISDITTTDSEESLTTEQVDQELLEQQAHSDAATEAQQAADDFIDKGDYAAAAEAREVAENEAWEAGDDSMLSSYDAQDLSTAADKQEDAAYYEKLETEHAQAGDYEAAKEAAGNAAYAMGDADYYAGGDDHTGQAKGEEYNMDNALWHEGLADDHLENAVYQAELGNADAAESALNAAASEQEIADDFGDRGEHGNIMADFDPSSEVETGGSYESTYDDNLADIETGFDPGIDTGVDTTVDTSYDSGIDDV